MKTLILFVVVALGFSGSAFGQTDKGWFDSDAGKLLSRQWKATEVRCLLSGQIFSEDPVDKSILTIYENGKAATFVARTGEGKDSVTDNSNYKVEFSNLQMVSKKNNFSHSGKIDFTWQGTTWSQPTLVHSPIDFFAITNYSFIQAQDSQKNDRLILFKQETDGLYLKGITRCPIGDVKIMIFEASAEL